MNTQKKLLSNIKIKDNVISFTEGMLRFRNLMELIKFGQKHSNLNEHKILAESAIWWATIANSKFYA